LIPLSQAVPWDAAVAQDERTDPDRLFSSRSDAGDRAGEVIVLERAAELRQRGPSELHSRYRCERCAYETLIRSRFENHVTTHSFDAVAVVLHPQHEEVLEALAVQPFVASSSETSHDFVASSTPVPTTTTRAVPARTFLCDDCGAEFSNHLALSAHMKSGHEAKAFKCPHCDHTTNQKADMQKHLFTHTNEKKPFQCDLCDYSAIRRELLEAHMNKHQGVKPYACPDCNFRSTSKVSLRIHCKRHQRDQDDDY